MQAHYLEQAKRCVAFVFEEGSGNPLGTGFFVGIKTAGDVFDVFAIYFVTAKHVLQKPDGEFYDKVIVRLNTRSGGFQNDVLDFSIHSILTHDDEDVDLAAILLYPDQNQYDYLWFQEDYFSDDAILREKGIW